MQQMRRPAPCGTARVYQGPPLARSHRPVRLASARAPPKSRLLGALAHLPALALKAARALLLPLPAHLRVRLFPRVGLVAHATAQAKHQVQRRFLLDVIVGEGATVLQLLARKDQALLVRRDALLVLDL